MSIQAELLSKGHGQQMKEWRYRSSTLGKGGFFESKNYFSFTLHSSSEVLQGYPGLAHIIS